VASTFAGAHVGAPFCAGGDTLPQSASVGQPARWYCSSRAAQSLRRRSKDVARRESAGNSETSSRQEASSEEGEHHKKDPNFRNSRAAIGNFSVTSVGCFRRSEQHIVDQKTHILLTPLLSINCSVSLDYSTPRVQKPRTAAAAAALLPEPPRLTKF